MEKPLESVAEAIRNLQANQIVQARLLRAIIATHPNPGALREAWRNYASPSIANAELAKASEPARRAVHEAMLLALRDWDGYLDRDLPDA